ADEAGADPAAQLEILAPAAVVAGLLQLVAALAALHRRIAALDARRHQEGQPPILAGPMGGQCPAVALLQRLERTRHEPVSASAFAGCRGRPLPGRRFLERAASAKNIAMR